MHRRYIPIYIQKDAALHSLFMSGNCSTCFGWYFHTSSEAHTTVSTASGICHIVEELEPVWVCCGWRTSPTAHSNRFQLFHDSGRCSIAHSIICTRLFRGKMHSDWFNGIEILQGRWQHGEKVGYCYPSGLEKTLCKWNIYVPLVTKVLRNEPSTVVKNM